jgi:hypothetical protein
MATMVSEVENIAGDQGSGIRDRRIGDRRTRALFALTPDP